jgi:hypothetical protein
LGASPVKADLKSPARIQTVIIPTRKKLIRKGALNRFSMGFSTKLMKMLNLLCGYVMLLMNLSGVGKWYCQNG